MASTDLENIMEMRTCKKCNVSKELGRHNFGGTGGGNLRHACRPCHNASAKADYQNNKNKPGYQETKRGSQASKMHGHLKPEMMKLQDGKCFYCKCDVTEENEIDHINPVRRGGGEERSNLQLLCKQCNREKNSKNHSEHMAWREMNKKWL